MSEYQLLSLGQICSLIKDGTHGTHPRHKDGIPLISAKDVQDGRITISSATSRISREEYETIHRTYEIKEDDLLISLVGSIGRSALVTREHGIFSAQRSVGILRSDRSMVDPKYLYHATCDNQFQQQLQSRSKSTAQAGVYLGELAQCSILLPPLPEQKKIAEILSGIDTDIYIHQQKAEDLGILIRELLRDHFQEKCEGSDLRLEKVTRTTIQYGANASASKLRPGEPRYIRITDIKEDGTLNELNAVGIDLPLKDCSDYMLNEGDLLLARTGNTIGKSYLHSKPHEELVFAGYLLRVALDKTTYRPEYLFLFTQSDIYKNWIFETSRTGAQPNINAKEYGSMTIPSAYVEEQDDFIAIAMSLRSAKGILNNKIEKLKLLKQAISSDLLSGRRRVSV